MKFNTDRFKIGDKVHVKSCVLGRYDNRVDGYKIDTGSKRFLYKSALNTEAVVTGLGRRYEGTYHAGGGSCGMDYEDIEQAYLYITKTVLVWLVRVSMFSREYAVLDEDIEPCSDPSRLPTTRQPEWTEKWRQQLRDDMKTAPRDSKGRWIKNTPPQKET